MTIITVITDFGLKDGFSGVLKGVIWTIAPEAHIADITHEISPRNIMEGALTMRRAIPFFPAGTIHLVIVDPGVGTSRRSLAARLGDLYFVGPDNGLITPLLEEVERAGQPISIVQLTNPDYWLPEVSNTFHGRDIFSPVAAHLANGVPLEKLGSPIKDPIKHVIPQPIKIPGGWRGQTILIDIFGNIVTNFGVDLLKSNSSVMLKIAGRSIQGLVKSYGEKHAGQVVALVDSEHYIEVAVVYGNAAFELGASVGDSVELLYQ